MESGGGEAAMEVEERVGAAKVEAVRVGVATEVEAMVAEGKAVAEREAGVKAAAATAVAVMGVVATEGVVKAEGATEEEATASFLARRCVCP
jgi:hypothetical protein